MQHFRTCPRCGGTGKYDRGTCFGCKGRRAIPCAKPATPEWQVTAIWESGERCVMKNYRAKTADAAIKKTRMARNWEGSGFDMSTIEAKQRKEVTPAW